MNRKDAEKIAKIIRDSDVSEQDARGILLQLEAKGIIRGAFVIWKDDILDAARDAAWDAELTDDEIPKMVDKVAKQMSAEAYIELYERAIREFMQRDAGFLTQQEIRLTEREEKDGGKTETEKKKAERER